MKYCVVKMEKICQRLGTRERSVNGGESGFTMPWYWSARRAVAKRPTRMEELSSVLDSNWLSTNRVGQLPHGQLFAAGRWDLGAGRGRNLDRAHRARIVLQPMAIRSAKAAL